MEVCLILSHQFNDYQCILYQFTIRSRFFPQVGDLLVASQALQLDVIHIHQGSHGQRLLANSTTLFLSIATRALNLLPTSRQCWLKDKNGTIYSLGLRLTLQEVLKVVGHFLIDIATSYCMSEACLINNTLSHLPLFLYQIDS